MFSDSVLLYTVLILSTYMSFQLPIYYMFCAHTYLPICIYACSFSLRFCLSSVYPSVSTFPDPHVLPLCPAPSSCQVQKFRARIS